MKYQEIREAFKECGILVSKDGISLVYQQYEEPRFIVVNVDDEDMGNRAVFEELLKTCDGIRIVLTPGRGNRLDFIIDLPIEHDLFFPPLRRELTSAEIDELIRTSGRGPRKEFLDVFSEVDLNDEDAVLAGISETIRRTMQGEVLPVSGLLGWPGIKAAAREFYDKTHFGSLAIEDPDQWVSTGSAIFDFESDKPRVFELRKDDLPGFIKLAKMADWLSLDGFSSDERANFVISFYS